MFCFAHFDKYRMPERNIGSTASALMLNTGQDCGYRQLDDHISVWELAASKAQAKAWMPVRSESGKIWLFSGFILNPDQLIADLGISAKRTYRDAELYGMAFDAWGDVVDDRVHGEYAALAWDPREQTTRLVRSPISAPPLHYTRQGNDYVVATAPRGIFGTGLVERQLDELKIADSLFLNYHEEERGWFENVSRVPVGTRMVIGAAGIRQEQFFDVATLPDVRLSGDQEYIETANHLLSEGVRRNMQGFTKPAVSMSGGFDSQSVAVFALDHLPENQMLDVYTSVPQKQWDGRTHKNKFGDESAHVQALLDMYPRLRSHLVDSAGLSFDHNLQAMFMLAETSPRNAMNLHWIHEIRTQAKRAGCDVVLTAGRGNATFSFDGVARLPTLFREFRWLTLFRELKARPEPDRSLVRRLLTRAAFPNLPEWLQSRLYRAVFGAPPDGVPVYSALNPAWETKLNVSGRAIELGFDTDFKKPRSNRQMHINFFSNAINEAGDLMQGMEQIAGIPSRDPTGYRPLIEFCCGIPDDQYYRNGVPRLLARRMMKGRLPDMVLDENRRGLQAADWLSRLEPHREELLRELDRLEQDESEARRIDVAKLRGALLDWPTETPVGKQRAAQLLHLALPRALATNRFIRYVEGKN